MRFNIGNQPYFKFIKKFTFGGLKSIFFISSLSYFCIYFFNNIDQISFDVNLERNGINLFLSFLFCILSIYLNAYAWKYIVRWFGKEFKSNNLVSFYVLTNILKYVPGGVWHFVEKLRIEGAYDVSYQAINMKKNRIGFSLQAILPTDKKEYFRRLWFDYSNTIGVREKIQSRWKLLRRRGECSTKFGNIKVKQTLKPDGSITIKPENDEVLRLKLEHKISTEEIRKIIKDSSKKFKAFENWK